MQISSDGRLTFTNRPEKVSYTFDLIVRNSGGTTTLHNGDDVDQQYNPTLTIDGFKVTTICGLYSTTVETKVLQTTSITDGNIPLDLLDVGNSNSECPILTIVHTDRGSSICRVSESNNGEYSFTLSRLPGSGAYECFALATAEGGASGTISKHYFIPW